MNFEEAMSALDGGQKVKLTEWVGYWFKRDGKILVMDRKGDILETPYLEDFKNRTDWEITDGKRDFGGALIALKAGKRVARTGWNGKNMFLFLVPGSTFKVNRPPLLGIYEEGTEIKYHAHIDMKTASGEVVPWLCSQTDALAEDWEIIS